MFPVSVQRLPIYRLGCAKIDAAEKYKKKVGTLPTRSFLMKWLTDPPSLSHRQEKQEIDYADHPFNWITAIISMNGTSALAIKQLGGQSPRTENAHGGVITVRVTTNSP